MQRNQKINSRMVSQQAYNKVIINENSTAINRLVDDQNDQYLVHSFNEKEAFCFTLNKNKLNESKIIQQRLNQDLIIKSINDILTDKGTQDYKELFHKINFRNNFRKCSTKQLATGSIPIDFTNAIFEGTFVTCKKNNKKQSQNWTYQISSLNKNKRIILVSFDEKVGDAFLKGNQENKKTLFLLNSEDKGQLYLMIAYLKQYLKQLIESGEESILIVDELNDFFYSTFGLRVFDKEYFLIEFLRDLHYLTGQFETGSLTSFLISSTHTPPIYFLKNYENVLKELNLLTNVNLDMTLSIQKLLKQDISSLHQNPIINYYQNKTRQLIVFLDQEYSINNQYKEFQIERDSWDLYHIKDAEYYIPILQNQKILQIEEQLLVVSLVHFLIENDLISYFDIKQDLLIQDFLKWIEEKKIWGDHNGYDFISFTLKNNSKIEEVIPTLEKMNQDYFNHLQTRQMLLRYKKDYFEQINQQ